MTDAIRAAEEAAVAAIERDLDSLIAAKDLTSRLDTARLARLLAHDAFGAMVIPADYVQGHRDAMAKVRDRLAAVTADPWVPADGETEVVGDPGRNPHVALLPGGTDGTLDWIGPNR